MLAIDSSKMDELRQTWTDRRVTVRAERPELQRFAGKVGRVVTVNFSGKAVVDFSDGAWYDIPASEEFLTPLSADDPLHSQYDATANSAQAHPARQG
jgi:hypothetical protein